MKNFVRTLVLLVMCVLLAVGTVTPAFAEYDVVTLDHAISFTGMELNDPIDGMWQGEKENPDTKGVVSYNEGISGDGKSVKLNGYQSGKNVSYVYTDPSELHNKLIKFRMVFDGTLPNIDASFVSFALRVPEYSSKFFWDSYCYSILIKGHRVEVQKHPAKYQGKDNNLGGTKGKTPFIAELETPFKAGTYDVEIGAIDGISPNTGKEAVNLIFRLNGKELVNMWDDSGRTPPVTNQGYFIIAPIFTQEDVQDEVAADQSRSSITILPYSEEPLPLETSETVSAETPASVPAADQAPAAEAEEASCGLSAGAIIGIAAGVVVVIGATVLILIRRKKK